jgi:hypothetical protein
LIFSPKPTIKTVTIIFLLEVQYDKTDPQANGLAALRHGRPDGMQRKA